MHVIDASHVNKYMISMSIIYMKNVNGPKIYIGTIA